MWNTFAAGNVPRRFPGQKVSISHNVYLKMFVEDLLHPAKRQNDMVCYMLQSV